MDGKLDAAKERAAEIMGDSGVSFIEWVKGLLTWNNFFKLIGVFAILLALWIIFKIIRHGIKKIPAEKLSPQKSMIIMKALSYAFYIIAIMNVLALFGINLSAIWGAAGVAGVAVAFAAQTSVSNIISGIFVVAEKALKIGDLITVEDETGFVDNIGLLSVTVHTLDNQMVRIPNSKIIDSNLRNTTYFPHRRMNVECTIPYSVDLEFAIETLSHAADSCKVLLKDPAPVVWVDSFGEYGAKVILAVWFRGSDFFASKNEAFVLAKRALDNAKIEIPYNRLFVKFDDGVDSLFENAGGNV